MFPNLTSDLLEQVNNISNTSSSVTELGRSFKFDYNTGSFVLVDGKLTEVTDKASSVEQWILLGLHTLKDKYNIYKGTDFYCNVTDLIGGKLNAYKKSELEREITNFVRTHRYVKSVSDFNIEQTKGKVNVSFTVTLVDDSEVEVSTSV